MRPLAGLARLLAREQVAETLEPLRLADHESTASSFGNRDAEAIIAAAACWPADRPELEHDVAWARTAWEAIRPYLIGGNYVKLQTADDDDVRLRDAYRDSLDRLRTVKEAYDPDNLFRVNRNIAPRKSVTPSPPSDRVRTRT